MTEDKREAWGKIGKDKKRRIGKRREKSGKR